MIIITVKDSIDLLSELYWSETQAVYRGAVMRCSLLKLVLSEQMVRGQAW